MERGFADLTTAEANLSGNRQPYFDQVFDIYGSARWCRKRVLPLFSKSDRCA
jgi:hypothetical protein